MHKVTARLVHQYFLSASKRYFYGSIGEVIGIAITGGDNFKLLLDTGETITVEGGKEVWSERCK